MLALNERQRAFVFHLVDQGGANFTRAASKAGYEGDVATLQVQGSRLAHDERISEAMVEEARRRLHASSLLAVSELHKIIEDPETSRAVRLRAIQMNLNRVGLASSQTHLVKHQVTVTDADKIANIQEMARKLGMDPAKLLGSYGITIDADFEEVPNKQLTAPGQDDTDAEPDEDLEEETW